MISATYFGEITELDSRAVWYSDEEDDEEDEHAFKTLSPTIKPVEPVTHETFRSQIQVNFRRVMTYLDWKFTTCVISLSSQYKNAKFNDSHSLIFLGNLDSVGKAFAYRMNDNSSQQAGQEDEYLLWLIIDSTHQYLVSHEVGYFVETFRETLHEDFRLNHPDCKIIILSRRYSSSEHLEYLTNYTNFSSKLPFYGCPLSPPSIITNQFESSLFEQLTLALKPALIVCLPDPKNFWFDKTKNWPTIPNQIIEHKLNDDSLDKTLIFT